MFKSGSGSNGYLTGRQLFIIFLTQSVADHLHPLAGIIFKPPKHNGNFG